MPLASGHRAQWSSTDGKQWNVQGYSTLFAEFDEQLGGASPDMTVTPVGVGSLAQAVLSHSKRSGSSTRVLTVELDTAACLWTRLDKGNSTPVETSSKIMAGMNCRTLSTSAWPILRAGGHCF